MALAKVKSLRPDPAEKGQMLTHNIVTQWVVVNHHPIE